MLEDYDSTLPYRIGFAVVFFTVLGILDWVKNPTNPTRVREYLFLLVAMCVWVTYGVVHDHVTATISPEYFLNAKGLASSPRPFRIAVTMLAAKATYGPGALVGALLLFANNPTTKGNFLPQLSYRELFRICCYGVLLAMACAVVIGTLSSLFGSQTVLLDLANANGAEHRAREFAAVWGIHAGSYLGAFLGSVWGTMQVVRRRKRRVALEWLKNDLR